MRDVELLLNNLCCYAWLAAFDGHPSYDERVEGQ